MERGAGSFEGSDPRFSVGGWSHKEHSCIPHTAKGQVAAVDTAAAVQADAASTRGPAIPHPPPDPRPSERDLDSHMEAKPNSKWLKKKISALSHGSYKSRQCQLQGLVVASERWPSSAWLPSVLALLSDNLLPCSGAMSAGYPELSSFCRGILV